MTLQNEMTNREKFLALVSQDLTEKTMKDVNYRIENREAIRGYQELAMKILVRLDELKISKQRLSELTDISLEQINKIVTGKEFTDENIISKIEEVLNIK